MKKLTFLNVADVTLKFMLDELKTQDSSFSKALSEALIKRIKQRRINYADVLEYLLNPTYEKSNGNENYGIFYTSSKTVIRNLIVQLLENKLEKEDSEI